MENILKQKQTKKAVENEVKRPQFHIYILLLFFFNRISNKIKINEKKKNHKNSKQKTWICIHRQYNSHTHTHPLSRMYVFIWYNSLIFGVWRFFCLFFFNKITQIVRKTCFCNNETKIKQNKKESEKLQQKFFYLYFLFYKTAVN